MPGQRRKTQAWMPVELCMEHFAPCSSCFTTANVIFKFNLRIIAVQQKWVMGIADTATFKSWKTLSWNDPWSWTMLLLLFLRCTLTEDSVWRRARLPGCAHCDVPETSDVLWGTRRGLRTMPDTVNCSILQHSWHWKSMGCLAIDQYYKTEEAGELGERNKKP